MMQERAIDEHEEVPRIVQVKGAAVTIREQHNWVWGTGATLVFILIWLCSMAAPLVLLYAYLQGSTESIATTAAIVCLAYAPWPVSSSISHFFGVGAQKYFYDFSLLYEETFVNADQSKKLLCVHPHGVVCIGWAILFNRPELRGVSFCFRFV